MFKVSLEGIVMGEIALYPSSHHVLPGGRADIKIAEERYHRMLKESLAGKRCLALCMLNEPEVDHAIKTIPAIVTLCDVINFDMHSNGVLSITIEGSQKVRLLGVSIEHDGLFHGEYTTIANWSSQPLRAPHIDLAEKLDFLFQTMPEVGTLYPSPEMSDLSWVCQRWIEILPLEVHYKQLLITQDTPMLTVRFLHKLFQLK
ncbi:Lon protease [Photobacterium makurazakiensis]|uniref:LON peptidase substrate-binding domain-containing protein n=1 Tax=Photobacterium makurazakiensis TaxID=2910234 RepID=UPI003D0F5B39